MISWNFLRRPDEEHAIQQRASYPLYDLKGVGKKAGESTILEDVSFRVMPGEFCGITGHSGAGKSTLLNILGGIDIHTAGTVFFHGAPLMLASRPREAVRMRRSIGFVFQAFHLLPRLTILDNVGLPLSLRRVPRAEARARVVEALRSVNLLFADQEGTKEEAEFLARTPPAFSGGEQQRVAIARALVSEPDVILADEPTGNLDSRNSGDVMKVLSSIRESRKITVILVTHSEQALGHCKRVLRLHDGRLVDDSGAPAASAPTPMPTQKQDERRGG